MVAAVAANQALDASAASELGSLLLCHRSIRDPRWRLDAAVRLVPVHLRFGISLDPVRAEIRRGVAAAVCVPAWREHLGAFLRNTIEHGCVESLRLAVEALWTRSAKRTAERAREAAYVPYRPQVARVESVAEALARARGIRYRSIRAGTYLLLSRTAPD